MIRVNRISKWSANIHWPLEFTNLLKLICWFAKLSAPGRNPLSPIYLAQFNTGNVLLCWPGPPCSGWERPNDGTGCARPGCSTSCRTVSLSSRWWSSISHRPRAWSSPSTWRAVTCLPPSPSRTSTLPRQSVASSFPRFSTHSSTFIGSELSTWTSNRTTYCSPPKTKAISKWSKSMILKIIILDCWLLHLERW